MNILGFVTGLLMIFAISSYSLWEKGISQQTIDSSYQGYLEASRNVQNDWESTKYRRIKNLEKKKETKPVEFFSTQTPAKQKKNNSYCRLFQNQYLSSFHKRSRT